jgi:hypothetical protein
MPDETLEALMLPIPADDAVRNRLTSIDQAAAVLATHVPTEDGLCRGCLHGWGRWVPATGCTQLAWARSVIETHGVADDAWDLRSDVDYRVAVAM